MKRAIIKVTSMMLVLVMCLTMLPLESFAWGKMTHVYTANYVMDNQIAVNYESANEDIKKTYTYAVPQEFRDAINSYPDAFRAGALGPDMYPDIVTGQMYIHPEDPNIDSGKWVAYMCDAVNKMGKDTEGRKFALSFTLGCILHYCGDLFGHDFVNTFAGGAFPSLMSPDIIDLEGERLNNILNHLSVEKYMDSQLYSSYDPEIYGHINAPNKFVRNVMVFNGSPSAGLAPLYKFYPELPLDSIESETIRDLLGVVFDENSNNVPPHYTIFLTLRNFVASSAEKYREHMEPASAIITAYNDAWLEDIDMGIAGFADAWDNIAERMVTGEKNPDIEDKKVEEWKDDYNGLVVPMFEEYVKNLKAGGATEEELEALKDLQTLGISGRSFFDEILRELLREGIITEEMLAQSEGSITIIKEEISYWWDEYVPYMILPDIIVEGIEIPYLGDIINLLLLGPIWSQIKIAIKNKIAELVVYKCTGLVESITDSTAQEVGRKIAGIVEKVDERLEDPQLQLDHPDNPFKPSEDNFAEFKEYMDRLPLNMDATDEDAQLEALQNTLTMFYLVLMGPDNYSNFVSSVSGVNQTAYHKNTASLEATTLKVTVKTSDLFLSGTNDNIYLNVYEMVDGIRIVRARKLMDIGLYDDHEAGVSVEYTVELPKSVKLSRMEIGLSKTPAFDFIPSMTDDWVCENIEIMPLYAGYELFTEAVDLGGVKLTGICEGIGLNFQTALKAGREPANQKNHTVTTLRVDVKVANELWAGTDSDVYVAAYNGNKLAAKVCLDKAAYNDLEQNDSDIYMIPVTIPKASTEGIPLNKLSVKLIHEGDDQVNLQSVIITPCYGGLALTNAISVGGAKFENATWETSFQSQVKNATYHQYEPYVLEYETNLDGGLVSYMGSLDGGEEWVDSENELWANTTLRKDVFFKIFRGFAPEMEYTGVEAALQCDPVPIVLDFKGMWNGIPNERREQVKDFEHVYPVDGTAKIEFRNEKDELVHTETDVDVGNGSILHIMNPGELPAGLYDLTVYYYPDEANPLFSEAKECFEDALKIVAAEKFEIKKHPLSEIVDPDTWVYFTVGAVGGLEPYTYEWEYYYAGAWHQVTNNSTDFKGQGTNKLSAVAKINGANKVRCKVSDSSGKSQTSNAANLIAVGDLSVTIDNGETRIQYYEKDYENKVLTANLIGGLAPYTYTWYIKGIYGDSAQWEEVGSGPQFTMTPDFRWGHCYIKVVVRDSIGKTAESQILRIDYFSNIN